MLKCVEFPCCYQGVGREHATKWELKKERLTTGIADLDASLADVNRNYFSHFECFFMRTWWTRLSAGADR